MKDIQAQAEAAAEWLIAHIHSDPSLPPRCCGVYALRGYHPPGSSCPRAHN